MASVILVGCGSSKKAVSLGDGACIARTDRFRMALESAGYLADVFEISGSRSDSRKLKAFLGSKTGLDAMVAVSPFPAEVAVRTGAEMPMWIDMNGMHPAEVQLAGGDYTTHRVQLTRMLSLEAALLMRGDRFSTPSKRQKIAVMAELLLLGRLDAASLWVDPVIALPHCVLPVSGQTRERSRESGTGQFLLISAGSFNRWFDHRTLFRALEIAMERNSSIRFVAAGGPVPHSPGSWEEFGGLAAGSRFRDRFSLPGWLEREDLEKLFARADAAIYADLPCPETLMGARTRALDWIARGIPVICTLGTEISEEIAAECLGLAVPQGDAEAMASAITSLASDTDLSRKINESQKAWGEGKGSMGEIFRPLLEWAACPQRLPSRPLGRAPIPGFGSLSYSLLLAREIRRSRGAWHTLKKALFKLKSVRSGD
jgi:glycosyltransferase involved in cell wall biosynthesis